MWICTSDMRFGINLVRYGFPFRGIQLRVGSLEIGDLQPCIPHHDLVALGNIGLQNARESIESLSPDEFFGLVERDEQLDIDSRVQLGESFDSWQLRALLVDSLVYLFLRGFRGDRLAAAPTVVVPFPEFSEVARAARHVYEDWSIDLRSAPCHDVEDSVHDRRDRP